MAQRIKHHRRPKSRGGGDHEYNISEVREGDHKAYHRLFGNMLADEVAAMLTDVWVDPDYYLIAVPRKKKSSKRRKRLYCNECQCEVMKHLPRKE